MVRLIDFMKPSFDLTGYLFAGLAVCLTGVIVLSSLGLRSINEKNATVVKSRHLSRGASKLRHFFSGRDLSSRVFDHLPRSRLKSNFGRSFACHRGKGRIGCVEALGLVCIPGRQLMSEERERMTTDAERQIAVDIVGRIV